MRPKMFANDYWRKKSKSSFFIVQPSALGLFAFSLGIQLEAVGVVKDPHFHVTYIEIFIYLFYHIYCRVSMGGQLTILKYIT